MQKVQLGFDDGSNRKSVLIKGVFMQMVSLKNNTGKYRRISVEEMLFYLYFVIMEAAKGIGLVSGGAVYKICLVAATLLAVCKILVGRYQIREYVIIFALTAIGLSDWVLAGNQSALICIILVVSMKNVPSGRLFKIGSSVWSITFLYQVLSQLLNLRYRDFVIHNKYHLGYLIRWALGYTHPNVLMIAYVVLIAYAFLAWDIVRRHRILFTVIALIGGVYVFLYSLSMTGLLFLLMLLVLVWIFEYMEKWHAFGNKVIKIVLQCIFPFAILISVAGPVLLQGRVFDIVNKLVTTRLALSRYYLTTFGISLLGRDFSDLPAAVTLDCSYTNLLMHGGFLLFMIMCIGYAVMIHGTVNETESWRGRVRLAIIISFIVAGMSEPFLFNESFKNLTLIFVGESLYQQTGKYEKKSTSFLCRYNTLIRLTVPVEMLEVLKTAVKTGWKKMVLTGALVAVIGGVIYCENVRMPDTIYALRTSCDTDDNSVSVFISNADHVRMQSSKDTWVLNYKDDETPMLAFSGTIVQVEFARGLISTVIWSDVLGCIVVLLMQGYLVKKKERNGDS